VLITLLRSLPLLAVLGAAGYGYHYVVVEHKDHIIEDQTVLIQSLREELAALTVSTQVQQQTITSLEETKKKNQKIISDLNKRTQQLSQERDAYMSIFRRHDLTKLSVAKPGLIEPRINDGTKDVFRDIESITEKIKNEEDSDRFDNFTYSAD